MCGRGELDETRLQPVEVGPGTSRSLEQCEGIAHGGYALKLSPQEQLVAALGFFTLNPPSVSDST